MKHIIISLLAMIAISVQASDLTTSSPEGAKVFIISPKNGDTIKSPFTIKFGINGMEIAPAGTNKKNAGHHHLLIDGKHLPDLEIPMGSDVIHFGKGQTETTLTLDEGKHTLQLILGNYLHIPHDPAIVSEIVTIEVKN